MYNPTLALVASFIAMSLIVVSYFVKKKEGYLLFQMLGIIFLVVSYFFTTQFFAMVGLAIAILRVLTYFLYERKDCPAPLVWAFVFSGLTIASYFIVNLWILQKAQYIDIVLIVASCFYAFVFRIRSLKTVRFLALIPTVLSILYNTASGAAIFVSVSYIFELTADIVSIFRYHIIGVNNDATMNNK